MMVSEALVDFLSGSAGGVANVVVGQPMDTVKVFHVMSCLGGSQKSSEKED